MIDDLVSACRKSIAKMQVASNIFRLDEAYEEASAAILNLYEANNRKIKVRSQQLRLSREKRPKTQALLDSRDEKGCKIIKGEPGFPLSKKTGGR